MSRSAYDRLEKDVRKPGYDEVESYIRILKLWVDDEEIALSASKPLSGTIVYLRQGLLYNTLTLTNALSCLKDLANSINCRRLSNWTLCEWVGYQEYPGFADYRICPLEYSVNFENEKEKFIDFPLPYELLEPVDEEAGWFYYCDTVAGFYEDFLLQDGEISHPANELPNSVQRFLRAIYGPKVRIYSVSRKIPAIIYRKIILAIKEIMLNFILSLERRFGTSPSIEVLRLNSREIDFFFTEALARTGKADHLDLPVKFKPVDRENNSDILMNFLYNYEVSDEHFNEIMDLLEEEKNKGHVPDLLGPPLINLIRRMTALYPDFGPEGKELMDAFGGYLGLDKGV